MTRKLDSFDTIFQTVTERAIAYIRSGRVTPDGEPLLRIPCETHGQAINVQMQLRQYWTALTKAAERGEITEYDPRHAFVGDVPRLAVRTAAKQNRTVELIDRSQLSTSRALARAVGALERAIRLAPGDEPVEPPTEVPPAAAVEEPPAEPEPQVEPTPQPLTYQSPATVAQDAVLAELAGAEPPPEPARK